jgi:YEATS domain-containing protein 4
MIKKFLAYGSCSTLLSKTGDDGATHKWVVYVRPFQQEDDFSYVRKVVFNLHETFDKHVRIVNKPPFEGILY